jgi:uncharacterized protein (TIGR04222 family)
MDNFFENSFARMYGPVFLVFYIMLSAIVILFVRYFLPGIVGKVKSGDDFRLPEQPDPYEIAYIRGTEFELLSLAIYNLIKRGYFVLRTDENKVIYLSKKEEKISEEALNVFEMIVFSCLNKEWKLYDFMDYVKKTTSFKSRCKMLKEKLEEEQLIWSDKQRLKFSTWKYVMIIILCAVSLYKIMAAIHHGHSNVGFLILLTPLSCFFVYRINVDFLATSKGEKRMDQLKSTFRFVQGNKLHDQPLYLQQLLLATYGFALLQYSNMSFLYNYFSEINIPRINVYFDISKIAFRDHGLGIRNGSNGGGGNCGSSCGGGGGCSGGCGGGCGGCGGCS